jgi:hypothetical protein
MVFSFLEKIIEEFRRNAASHLGKMLSPGWDTFVAAYAALAFFISRKEKGRSS